MTQVFRKYAFHRYALSSRGEGVDQKLGWRINELLLFLIIIFQFLDFLKLLSPFWDYVKKIVSWALIGYLFYIASPSKLFFGEKHAWWDATIIIGYFCMTLKTIFRFAAIARESMLSHVLDYVLFLPGTSAVKSVLTIPLSVSELNTFQYVQPYLPNASIYASTFGGQLTLNNGAIPFTLQAGNQTATAILQPYGFNGMIFQLYNTIVVHAAIIQRVSFILGALILIAFGIYGALRFTVNRPSILDVIHEEGGLVSVGKVLTRIFAVLFVMAAFFAILFNLVAEWLAIAIDAPLTMLGVAFYLVLAIRSRRRFHHRLKTGDLLSRMGNFGTNFLKEFAQLFTKWKTVPLGLSGLLVLHLLVDIGNYVVPYLTGRMDKLYFGQLGAGHEPLFTLIAASWSGTLGTKIGMLGLYLLNVFGILFLLILPAYIWYKAFRIGTRERNVAESEHHPDLPALLSALGLASITAFLVAPAFAVKGISTATLVGVDLQTRAITASNPLLLFVILLGAFLLLTLFGISKVVRNWLMAPLFITSILFFGLYTFQYFLSTVSYHLREGVLLFQSTDAATLFIGLWIFTFLVINLLFYIFGFVSFAYELLRD